jgi:CheY-like chemotaxis protein
MPAPYQVAFIGLSDAERTTIATTLRLLPRDRTPHYGLTTVFDDADFVIADAEHTPSVKLVLATERLRLALWVGTPPPMGSVAVVDRPLDARHLLRELDALVAQGRAQPRVRGTEAQPPGLEHWDAANRRRLAAAPPAERPAPTALLVDDSEIALRFLETRLQRWGLVMDRALSSGRAIELLAKRRYDLVFLDVELGPGSDLDGLALCQHIKRHEREGTPSAVFLVSAHAAESDRARGSLAGADGYLGKPLDEIELQRLLLRQGLKPVPSGPRG